jgi:hypothetical protein
VSEQKEQAALRGSVRERLASWLDRRRWWVLSAIVLLYAAGFSGRWRIGADSAEFARLGRALAEGEPYVGLLGRSPSSHPGLPWLLAANFRLFGADTLWPAILTVWLMGLGALALAYVAMRRRVGRPAAVAITGLCAMTLTFYQYSFELLADVPFALGFWLALLGYEELDGQRRARMWLGLGLLAGGVAVMAAFRSAALLFLAALLLVMLVRIIRGPRRWRWAMVLAAAVCAVLLSRVLDRRLDSPFAALPDESLLAGAFTDELAETAELAVYERLPKLFTETLPEAVFGVELGPAGIPVAVLLLVLAAGLLRVRLLWGALALAFIVEIGVLTQVTSRYLIPLMPLLAAAWWSFAAWVERRLRPPHGGRVFVALLVVWAAPNLVRVGDIVLEQHRPDFLVHYRHGKYARADALARIVRRHTPPDALVIIGADLSYELSYLSERSVVLPRPETWRRARRTARHRPTFVLRGPAGEVDDWMGRLRLRLGPALASRPGGPEGTWTLHAAQRVRSSSRPGR